MLTLVCTRVQKERGRWIFHQSEDVDDPAIFANGFPFLLEALHFDGAGLQDQFSALGIKEGAELVRAGWLFGDVVLLRSFVLISMGAFQGWES